MAKASGLEPLASRLEPPLVLWWDSHNAVGKQHGRFGRFPTAVHHSEFEAWGGND